MLTVFVIAMLSTLVVGMLKINSEEIQLIRNQIYAAQALALAEAGLNSAMAKMREDPAWKVGWDHMAVPAKLNFTGGEFSVEVDDNKVTITASVDSWQGYTSTVEAEVTMSADSPHIIRIDNYRVNEPVVEE
jgi:hypothetical protein